MRLHRRGAYLAFVLIYALIWYMVWMAFIK